MSKSRDIADSAATINYIDNVTSDVQSQLNTLTTAIDNVSVTSGTLTKTFVVNESSTINLSSSVLAPVVSVTKEVPQSGVTNNNWDVNSTTENYTRLNSAPATTLDFVGFDVGEASFVDSFSVSSQDSDVRGMAFNANGTKMFVVGRNGDSVYEYTLSTGFDVSTASYSQNFSLAAQGTSPEDIAFNSDGTKMFIIDLSGDAVYEYTLSTGFNVSTATYSQNFSVSAQEITPTGLSFNTDGTKMFVLGADGDDVNEYALSTGFDVSTASYSQRFSVASQETSPSGIAFNADGTKMFVVGTAGDDVNEYTLSTGFDISTASYSQNFDVSSQDTSPTGIAFDNNGSKMFVIGDTNKNVYEYTIQPSSLALGTGSFASADVGKTIEANDGAFVLTATDGSYVETTAPTSYDQVASGSWEMYGVVYNAADGDLELSGVTTGQFEVSSATLSETFSVGTQETSPNGIAFNTDGTKMFIVGESGNDVNEYTLSTGFDVSTASYSQNFSVSSQEGAVHDIAFNNDGTKMFIVGSVGDDVNEYTLSTGFDVSTASFVDSFSVSAQETFPSGIAFNSDGTKMFILGRTGDDVNEYTLGTGFDVSTASFVDSFSVSAQEITPLGLAFNTDGTKMFVVGDTGDDVNEYNLSTGFDVSTASYFQTVSAVGDPTGIVFNNDGSKMFILGNGADTVFEYTLTSFSFPTGYQPVHTTASIDSTYWTDINSMTADQAAGDGNVYYAISTDNRTTWTVIDNTDGERDIVRNNAGTWQYNSNGTYALETWTNATTNTELATLAEAMEGAVDLSNTFDVSTAVYSQNFSVSGQDNDPTGIAFNSDGTKMFIVGDTGNDVNEYTLSIGFDVSTSVYSQNFSVASQDTSPRGITFNTDGTKMFLVGQQNDSVYEYTLSTGFDISTASFVDSLSVVGQESSPRAVVFNTSGSKMFIVGTSGEEVNEYTLSTEFDISTASFVDAFNVSAQETLPFGLAFNTDGTKMFIVGASGDDVNEYTLSTGFDVSTASFVDSFSIASQETNPTGIAFSTDGSKMFILGNDGDDVNEYLIGIRSYINQMDKTQLDAVTDPNHIALGNDLDLAIVFNMTSGTTVPSSDGVAINYDANVLNKGAVLGTDYDFDAPAQDKVRITALAGNNLKVRVV